MRQMIESVKYDDRRFESQCHIRSGQSDPLLERDVVLTVLTLNFCYLGSLFIFDRYAWSDLIGSLILLVFTIPLTRDLLSLGNDIDARKRPA